MDTKTKDSNPPPTRPSTTRPPMPNSSRRWAIAGARGRARRGMSRKALALSSDVSERYLAQVESGETNPSIMVLRHRCRAGRLADWNCSSHVRTPASTA
jgi:ribosome-binding protein aMBF1 (putative translation factor)